MEVLQEWFHDTITVAWHLIDGGGSQFHERHCERSDATTVLPTTQPSNHPSPQDTERESGGVGLWASTGLVHACMHAHLPAIPIRRRRHVRELHWVLSRASWLVSWARDCPAAPHTTLMIRLPQVSHALSCRSDDPRSHCCSASACLVAAPHPLLLLHCSSSPQQQQQILENPSKKRIHLKQERANSFPATTTTQETLQQGGGHCKKLLLLRSTLGAGKAHGKEALLLLLPLVPSSLIWFYEPTDSQQRESLTEPRAAQEETRIATWVVGMRENCGGLSQDSATLGREFLVAGRSRYGKTCRCLDEQSWFLYEEVATPPSSWSWLCLGLRNLATKGNTQKAQQEFSRSRTAKKKTMMMGRCE